MEQKTLQERKMICKISKHMNEHLKLAHKVVDVVD